MDRFGRLHTTIRVMPSVRKHLLCSSNLPELQNEGVRCVYCIDLKSVHHEIIISQSLEHSDAVELKDDYVLDAPKIKVSTIFNIQNSVFKENSHQIVLEQFKQIEENTKFIIFNQSKAQLEFCTPTWKRRNENRGGLIFKNNTCQWLEPLKIFTLNREKDSWTLHNKVGNEATATVTTNPLLRESRLRMICDKKEIIHENDGEYYLPPSVVKHILNEKLKKIDNTSSSSYHYCTSDSDAKIDAAFKACENDTIRFVYENTLTNHTLAGCLRISDDEVQCYLHETLGFDSDYTSPLLKIIMEKIQMAFPNKPMRILLPKQRMQKDFYSCGVMAIKAIIYFAKHPKLMDKLFNQASATVQETFKISIIGNKLNMRTLSSEAERLNSISNRTRSKDPTKPENEKHCTVSDNNKTVSPVDVQSLPVGMIKLCQDITLLDNENNLDTKVNKTLDLKQYLEKFEVTLPKLNKNAHVTVNAAAIVKRYKYFTRYINDNRTIVIE